MANVTLRVLLGGAIGEEIQLDRRRVVIGRGDQCDYQIPSSRVSREHCEIDIDGARVRVRDLGSRNGTYVNDLRVSGSYPLRNGDTLRIARRVFAVQIDQVTA